MKKRIEEYIKTWETRCYFNGIPNEAPNELEVRNLVPSYRRICYAILSNDYSLKSLGHTPKVSKYYHAYKKIEIEARNKTKQLHLNL